MTKFAVFFCLACLARCASAQPADPLASPLAPQWPDTDAPAVNESCPVLPAPNLRWPGVVVITSIGIFLMAAVIGPVARANAGQEFPPAHSHDEPPGASHHHGQSGTLMPDPPVTGPD